jgi:putative nucleotidyltransferase with HDIG domain
MIAVRVLQLTNNENVQLHQLSELISSDAAFASEVLTIANSIVYAPRFPAHTILQAIAVLGRNHLQGMCLTVGVRSYLGKSLNHPLIRNVWRHNLACALVARQLAGAGFMDQDAAYTSGVLHDVGRLALAILRPGEYAALLEKHKGSGASILSLEAERFGCDHCQAGRHLVTDWKLPSEFDAIVSEHHAPRSTESAWSMAELRHHPLRRPASRTARPRAECIPCRPRIPGPGRDRQDQYARIPLRRFAKRASTAGSA